MADAKFDAGGEGLILVMTASAEGRHDKNRRAEELISKMAAGELDAMGELYELIEVDVFSYALSKAVSRADAEDITHDTFVQIWRSAPSYRPLGKPLAWVFTIEINVLRKHINRQRRLVTTDEPIEVEDEESNFSVTIAEGDMILRLMNMLSEEEREIISLHVVSGLKHREIAKLLGKPLSTVLSKYNRAIKRLRIKIKEEGD